MKLKNLEVKTFKVGKSKAPTGGRGFKDATFEYVPEDGGMYGVSCEGARTLDGKEVHLVVIDVDNKGDGMYIWEHLTKGVERFSKEDIDTFTVKTQGGGLHLYYTVDNLYPLPPQMARNIDIKSKGGYVVGAGSVGEKGPYTIVNDVDIKPLPKDLFEFILSSKQKRTSNDSPINDEYILTDEDKDKILNGLMENREWDENGYDERYKVLAFMKSAGFDYEDFSSVIDGSSTGKSSSEWKTSWNSSSDEYEAGKVLSLAIKAKVFIPGLTKDTRGVLREFVKVKTLKEAYDTAFEMFKDRYVKINVHPNIYIYDIKLRKELTEASFHSNYKRYNIEVEGDRKYKTSKLYEEKAMAYKGYDFRPDSNDAFVYNKKDDEVYINTYQPLNLNINYNWNREKFKLIDDYILNVLASGRVDVANIIHTFVAKTVLNPTDRVNAFALAAHSLEEGTGKSFFGEFIYNLLGGYGGNGSMISSVKSLASENNLIKNKIFVYIDESAGNWNKNEIDLMKSLITSERFNVKQKYISTYEANNYSHWYFNSNDINVVPLGLDDRRYMVVEVSNIRQGDRNYFGKLKEEMENEEAISHYLGFISQFKDVVVKLPDNKERIEQKISSLGAEESWLLAMLEENSMDWNIYDRDDLRDGEIPNLQILYDMFQNFVLDFYPNGRLIKGKRNFLSVLKKRGFLEEGQKQRTVDGKNYKYYQVSTKDELRKLFINKSLFVKEEY